MPKSGVVLVHTSPPFRQMVRFCLADSLEFCVTGEASNEQQAAQLIDYTNPDIVLIALHPAGGVGLDTAYTIQDAHPELKIVLVIPDHGHLKLTAAQLAEFCACISESASPDELLTVLHRLHSGLWTRLRS